MGRKVSLIYRDSLSYDFVQTNSNQGCIVSLKCAFSCLSLVNRPKLDDDAIKRAIIWCLRLVYIKPHRYELVKLILSAELC